MEGRNDKKYQDIMPGMSQVVEAGDELTVRDREGAEFSITAKVDDKTMEFIVAFDNWHIVHEEGVRGVVVDALWSTVIAAYGALPQHVQEQLPSCRRRGIVLKGIHDHA